jgi:hypothetical protein
MDGIPRTPGMSTQKASLVEVPDLQQHTFASVKIYHPRRSVLIYEKEKSHAYIPDVPDTYSV